MSIDAYFDGKKVTERWVINRISVQSTVDSVYQRYSRRKTRPPIYDLVREIRFVPIQV